MNTDLQMPYSLEMTDSPLVRGRDLAFLRDSPYAGIRSAHDGFGFDFERVFVEFL